MEPLFLIIISAIVGIAIGFFIGKNIVQKSQRSIVEENEKKASAILKNAEQSASKKLADADTKVQHKLRDAERKNEKIKQRKISENKERFIKLKNEHENRVVQQNLKFKEREIGVKELENNQKQKNKEIQDKQSQLKSQQNELTKKKDDFKKKEQEITSIKDNLDRQIEIVTKKKELLEKANEERIHALEKVSNLTQQEAKEEILKAVEAKSETEALAIVKNAVERAKANANKEAKKIVIQSIQRMCAEYTIENTVSVFNLESDDIKGQIIGREGRNIRALEAATGAEIIVDDTPEAIVISSFDPLRREVCRLSLQRLVADGRIHPARIEEVVSKTRKELDEQVMEIGERTVIELDIHGLHPALVKMVGRMRFRSSYGQNLLKHSIETAYLCATMAAELGLSPKQARMAKRAGLLHDIGKVAEEQSEFSHAIIGMKMCEKHKEHPAIVNAVGAHHDEVDMTYIISPIVQSGDAISGARPGARREILESYLKRIGELEELAIAHEGVQKAYAMQAGRELRVIVSSDKITDSEADNLSFKISQQIEGGMQYPGQIKVTVIREKRAVSYAR